MKNGYRPISEKGEFTMGKNRVDIGEYCDRILKYLAKNSNDIAVYERLTKPVVTGECRIMPLPFLAATGHFDTLRDIARFVNKNCTPNTVAAITAAQGSKDVVVPIGDDMELDAGWTLYHVYAAAGSFVRQRLTQTIKTFASAELRAESLSGLFKEDGEGRIPLEIALKNYDPAGGVQLMEKTFRFLEMENRPGEEKRRTALRILERVGDDEFHSALMRGYNLTSTGLLTQREFFQMAKSLRDYEPNLMRQEMNIVLNNVLERDDVGFFRSVLDEFAIPIAGRAFMDDNVWTPDWMRLCAHVENELNACKGTPYEGEVSPKALMLKHYMAYIDGADRASGDDPTPIVERQSITRERFPLCAQMLDDMKYSFDNTRYKAVSTGSKRDRDELRQETEEEIETPTR